MKKCLWGLAGILFVCGFIGLWMSWFRIMPKLAGVIDMNAPVRNFGDAAAAESAASVIAMSGQVGDMYGALNALLTTLAFLGVVYTIVLQRRQLAQSTDENRNNLASNRIERFEGTFFQLLRLLNDIVSETQYSEHPTHRGRAAYREITGNLLRAIREVGDNDDLLREYCENFFAAHDMQLDHYFRVLYRILRWIDHSKEVPTEEKIFYAKTLRAQLTPQELALIFYNGITEEGMELRPFVIERTLLKHFPLRRFESDTRRRLYPEGAYTDPEDLAEA